MIKKNILFSFSSSTSISTQHDDVVDDEEDYDEDSQIHMSRVPDSSTYGVWDVAYEQANCERIEWNFIHAFIEDMRANNPQ